MNDPTHVRAVPHGIPATIGDLLAAGRAALPEDLGAHIATGAGDGNTVDANRHAIERRRLVPAVARGVGTPDTNLQMLGLDLAAPVMTAPMGPLELIDPDGAVAVARGAAHTGVATVIALTSAPVFEEVVTVGAPSLLQLYWWGDRDWIRGMIARAEAAGCAGVVITVDVPDYGTRWADVRSGFDHHGQMALPNLADAPSARAERLVHQASLTWEDLEWACSVTELPVAIKGVLSGADAARAVDVGAAAVYVSNHGGRALANQVATLDVLAEVSAAVDKAVPVIVDGGIRTAEDICIALAVGADIAALGRPVAWALAAAGSDGVSAYLDLVRGDLVTALTVLGVPSVVNLSSHHVRTT